MTLDELIMTRVSHDLAGIIGALHNTAELLEIDPSFASESGAVIKTSTATLMARLKFFRGVFGLDGAPLNTQIVQDYLKTLSGDFTLAGTITTRAQAAAVLICADTMLRGGHIDITPHSVTGTGQIKSDETLMRALSGSLTDISPKSAPAVWLAKQPLSSPVSADMTQNHIVIHF